MQDFRLAFRALRATSIVTVVAILSFALGIGANTAIFSLVDSHWLRMLPVKEPGRLVLVTNSTTAGTQSWSYRLWEQIRDRPQLFDGTTACSTPNTAMFAPIPSARVATTTRASFFADAMEQIAYLRSSSRPSTSELDGDAERRVGGGRGYAFSAVIRQIGVDRG
jgi:hypothetical protein